MREEHFDLLTPPLRCWVVVGSNAVPREVPHNLVFLAADTAGICVGAAFGFRRAVLAIGFESTVVLRFQARRVSGGVGVIAPGVPELLSFRADVAVFVLVPCEVGPRPGAVLAL